MPYKHITQEDARWYLKRAITSENKLKALGDRWASNYPGAILGAFAWPKAADQVATVRKCGRVAIAVAKGDVVTFYAADL